MSTTYFFHEPGSAPGIPGLFSGVRVDVADDGSFTVSPLPYHPHAQLEPAPVEEEAPVTEEKLEEAKPKATKQAKVSEQKEGA